MVAWIIDILMVEHIVEFSVLEFLMVLLMVILEVILKVILMVHLRWYLMEHLMVLLMVLMVFLKVQGVSLILVVFLQVTTMGIFFSKIYLWWIYRWPLLYREGWSYWTLLNNSLGLVWSILWLGLSVYWLLELLRGTLRTLFVGLWYFEFFLLKVVSLFGVIFKAMVWASIITMAQTIMGIIFKGMSRYMVKPLKKKYFWKNLFL